MPQKHALLIGLNNFDPDHYNNSTGTLQFAEKDVMTVMQTLAGLHFDSLKALKTSNATRENVLENLAILAQTAKSGDLVVVYYSGHGGAVADKNGDEATLEDQTWCLYDGELLDDELWMAWSQFEEGVNILLLSDSCHSGSIARVLDDQSLIDEAVAQGAKYLPRIILQKTFLQHKAFYNGISKNIPNPDTITVKASLLSLSACKDEEFAYEDRKVGQSHFTYQLLATFVGGQFEGNYNDFFQAILGRMSMPQTPQINRYGIINPVFEASVPFSVVETPEKKITAPGPDSRGKADLLVSVPGGKGLPKANYTRENWVGTEQYGTMQVERFACKDNAPSKDWDRAHALLDEMEHLGHEVVFIEPNLENFTALPEVPQQAKGEEAAEEIFLSTWPHPKPTTGFQHDWHLGEGYSQLAAARDTLMRDEALMAALKEKPIKIAHIDTGYSDIPLFKPERLREDLAKNFVEGNNNATDIDRIFTFPPEQQGHGTATLAILAGPKVSSPKGMEGFEGYLGAIPFAEVIPIRIQDSVALLKNNAFAKAVDYAIQQGCEVITMSMGGAPSKAWDDVVNEAYNRGITIVSAAGNSWRSGPQKRLPEYLLYPARFARVIGANGITYNQQPYIFDQNNWEEANAKGVNGTDMQGNYGPDHEMWHVLSAYTPNIFRAEAGPIKDGQYIEPYFAMTGGGTSSATPQVAATAALWIAKYREQLKPYAGTWKQVEAVRYALFKSAEKFDAHSGTIATPGQKNGKYYSYMGQGAVRAMNALAIAPPTPDVFELVLTPPVKTPSFPLFRTLFGLLKGLPGDAKPIPPAMPTTGADVRAEMLSLELVQLTYIDPDLTEFCGERLEDDNWLETLGGEKRAILKNKVKNSSFASDSLKAAVGGGEQDNQRF